MGPDPRSLPQSAGARASADLGGWVVASWAPDARVRAQPGLRPLRTGQHPVPLFGRCPWPSCPAPGHHPPSLPKPRASLTCIGSAGQRCPVRGCPGLEGGTQGALRLPPWGSHYGARAQASQQGGRWRLRAGAGSPFSHKALATGSTSSTKSAGDKAPLTPTQSALPPRPRPFMPAPGSTPRHSPHAHLGRPARCRSPLNATATAWVCVTPSSAPSSSTASSRQRARTLPAPSPEGSCPPKLNHSVCVQVVPASSSHLVCPLRPHHRAVASPTSPQGGAQAQVWRPSLTPRDHPEAP